MSLKRSQRPHTELAPTRTKGRSRRCHSLLSTSSTCSSSSEAQLPLASAPRTVEIMWGGRSAPGFTLKRKRTGAILVSTVTFETQTATTLQVGSQLKLVGGFPVNLLTLQDVKKVMLLAPKPVSLVFVNVETVVRDVELLYTRERKLSSVSSASVRRSMSLDSHNLTDDVESCDSEASTVSAPTFYSSPSDSNKSKKRKVSRLQIALDRVNQLLNRPVRQAGLHMAAGKSIVV